MSSRTIQPSPPASPANRATCQFRGLSLWTNGSETWIARSAEDAAQLERESVDTFIGADLAKEMGLVPTPAAGWSCIEVKALILHTKAGPVKWISRVWIALNGRGLLALEGELAPGRRAAIDSAARGDLR